jgi:hypothetical protein
MPGRSGSSQRGWRSVSRWQGTQIHRPFIGKTRSFFRYERRQRTQVPANSALTMVVAMMGYRWAAAPP